MLRKNFPTRKFAKYESALARQQAWSLLTIDDQLKELASRPGASLRQVTRLNKLKELGHRIVPAGGALRQAPVEALDETGKAVSKAPPKSDLKATKAFKKKNKQGSTEEKVS